MILPLTHQSQDIFLILEIGKISRDPVKTLQIHFGRNFINFGINFGTKRITPQITQKWLFLNNFRLFFLVRHYQMLD